MSITPSIRWKVFARDDFTCRYCGRSPPDVVLHCDHVKAQALGGGDKVENLVTACDVCNAGKAAKEMPLAVDERERRSIAAQWVEHFPRVSDAVTSAMFMEGERLELEGVKIEAVSLCMALAGIRLAVQLCDVAPLPKRIGKKRFLAMCAAQFNEVHR